MMRIYAHVYFGLFMSYVILTRPHYEVRSSVLGPVTGACRVVGFSGLCLACGLYVTERWCSRR
ncbi:hypothetical protein F4861DRAFT_523791 [Xylaria intraflava]|nr:hypothetical protein F4861DRAFT_523791 [Xylaria intraflava]